MIDNIEIQTADRRYFILRILVGAPCNQVNSGLITGILPIYGHSVARSKVHQDLTWLEGQALITLIRLEAAIWVATLTEHGHEVAEGLSIVPGIKHGIKPPGCK